MKLNLFSFNKYSWLSELDKLANRYGSDKGPTKHRYTRIYEQYFQPFRNERIIFAEIGLQRPKHRKRRIRHGSDAPSLRMWRDYFPHAEIIGFDLGNFSDVKIEGCKILQGDQSKVEDLARLSAAAPDGFDIIIDDASHASVHQQITFSQLFPRVKSGGLYFIEDLQFQPAAIEKGDVPKTREVFSRFMAGAGLNSPVWPIESSKKLSSMIAEARFFDSLSRGDPVLYSDALLVVRRV